jgi:hypothetical protein
MLGIHFLEKLDAPKTQQLLIGGGAGLFYLTTIEILDGFSSNWGFSGGDMLANLGGSLLAVGQHLVWKEQRLKVKFSYHHSGLAQYRPNVLGSNFSERLLKDYNAQTYWISFSPFAFSSKPDLRKLSWLCIAAGYGASGMLGAKGNAFTSNSVNYDFSFIPREREYLLSLDIDLAKIPCRKKWYKSFTTVIGMIKIPAPAIVLKGNKFLGRAIF